MTVTPLPQRQAPRNTGEIISRTVRLLMADRQVNQTMLAVVLGITQTQVSARLRGRTPWHIADLEALAAYFGVSVPELVGGNAGINPGGGGGGERARRDSNPQPSDPKVVPIRQMPKSGVRDRKAA